MTTPLNDDSIKATTTIARYPTGIHSGLRTKKSHLLCSSLWGLMWKEQHSGYDSYLKRTDWPSVRQQSKPPTYCSSAIKVRERVKLLNCVKGVDPTTRETVWGLYFFLILGYFYLFFALFLYLDMKSQPRCFQELELTHLYPLLPPSSKQIASINQSLHFIHHCWLLFWVSSRQSVCSRRRWMLEPARLALWLEVCPKGDLQHQQLADRL